MAFNGSGTYNRTYSWANDAASGIPITASRVDTEDTGFATGLSTCICKDGQTTTTAQIPFALGIKNSDGTVSAPSISFTSELGSGLYRVGNGEIGLAVTGVQVVDWKATQVTVGTGTGSFPVNVNGGNSGTSGGTAVVIQNAASSIAAFGNYSAIIGGAYDATSYLWASNTLKIKVGGGSGADLTITQTSTTIAATTTSSSSSTGALVVTGGIGSGGDVNWAGAAYTAYTPTVTATTGAFTSAAASLRYKLFGKKCSFECALTITTIGTASGRAKITLPVTNKGSGSVFPTFSARLEPVTVVGAGIYDTSGSISVDLTGATNGSIIHISGEYETV